MVTSIWTRLLWLVVLTLGIIQPAYCERISVSFSRIDSIFERAQGDAELDGLSIYGAGLYSTPSGSGSSENIGLKIRSTTGPTQRCFIMALQKGSFNVFSVSGNGTGRPSVGIYEATIDAPTTCDVLRLRSTP